MQDVPNITAPGVVEFGQLFVRAARCMVPEPMLTQIRMVPTVILALFVGLVFLQAWAPSSARVFPTSTPFCLRVRWCRCPFVR